MRRLAVLILTALLLPGCVHHHGELPFDRVIIEAGDGPYYYHDHPRYYREHHYYYHDEGRHHHRRHHGHHRYRYRD